MTETTAEPGPAPDALASVLADAPFVRLVATDDGDALAAAGTLARALRERAVPFQVRIARDPVTDAAGDDVAVALGADRGPHAIPAGRRPASTTAFAVARELGVDPDPVIALAGVVAAGSVPGTDGSGDVLEAAERVGAVTRRPGVAVPTADLADGIAASTLLRTPYSGDVEATRAALAALDLPAELDEDAHRRLASLVAVDVAGAEDASTRSASAVERALRPYAIDSSAGPFETVGGHADVLEALAREEPGTGVALALAADPGDGLRTAAVDAWRSHGTAAHRALDDATTGRYDGCLVARVDAPASTLPTVARILRDFRSPEPVAIVLDESSGRIAAAATEDRGIGDACRSAANEAGGDGWGGGTRGGIAVDGDPTDALAAIRGAL
ncbi:exonuclease RecJ [Halobellus captivus]|uniref:exonuclease RecJ n=1 Tax=Halobellus captivus TaxID=2592614 RepID=UPI000EFA94D5|nr:exonuclease RecJ [Halobellus captivus]